MAALAENCASALTDHIATFHNGTMRFDDLEDFWIVQPEFREIMKPKTGSSSDVAAFIRRNCRELLVLTVHGVRLISVANLFIPIAHTAPKRSTNPMDMNKVLPVWIDRIDVAKAVLKHLLRVGLAVMDMEGDLSSSGTASLLQVACVPHSIFVFDLLALRAHHKAFSKALRAVMVSRSVLKVFHDVRADSRALKGQYNIVPEHLCDSQLAYAFLYSNSNGANNNLNVGLEKLLQQYVSMGGNGQFKQTVRHRNGVWDVRPLSEHMLSYAMHDVAYLVDAHLCMMRDERMNLAAVLVQSKARINKSIGRPVAQVAKKRESNAEQAANKNGVIVSEADFGARVLSRKTVSSATITITNNSDKPNVLTTISPIAKKSPFTVRDLPDFPVILAPGEACRFRLEFKSTIVGSFKAVVNIGFRGFRIARFVSMSCGDVKLRQSIQPSAPYTKPKRKRRAHRLPKSEKVVEGVRPKMKARPKGKGLAQGGMPVMKVPLGHYKISGPWHQTMSSKRVAETLEAFTPLSGSSYLALFQRLLWTEEATLLKELQTLSIEAAVLHPRGKMLMLPVPGLAEGRPCVMRGDAILVDYRGKRYRGYVHVVELNEVGLQFAGGLHSTYKGDPVFVEFSLRRTDLRLMHQGLEKSMPGSRLFPSTKHLKRRFASRLASGQRLPDMGVQMNAKQLQAVSHVVRGETRGVPYILYGPPGTGKSATMIAIIRNLVALKQQQQQPGLRVLALAPTNAAADVYVERLSSVLSSRHMYRVMGAMRAKNSVSATVMAYTAHDGDAFVAPALDELRGYSVVVSTLSMAAKLMNWGIKRGHFDVICIDEAGNAIEPLAVAPVACLANDNTQLVLAGDPKQLGPVVFSSHAIEHGLDMSYLERLMQLPMYRPRPGARESEGFNAQVITKLVQNYRSHPALLSVPNELFYDNELVANAPQQVAYRLAEWEGLPRRGFPIVVHGVEGEEMRESNSPSWFNPDEAIQVLEYARMLVYGAAGLVAADIGIIAPYSKQKQKIRKLLASHAELAGIKVGSTEEFQGRERLCMIISTVRSSVEYFQEDVRHNLGFVANDKRFNVAVTRAQALLILVCNPAVLYEDESWRTLLDYCRENGANTGALIPNEVDSDGGDSDEAWEFVT